MNQENSSRFIDMAECYHRIAPFAVPHYDWLQENAIRLLRGSDTNGFLVDLGGGSGRFMHKYLTAFPKARGCIVDSSPPFLAVAERYLSEFSGRVSFIHTRIEDNWEERIEEAPSAVVSMSCIHHMLTEEKRTIYRKSVELLRAGGWLINVDEMVGHSIDTYPRHLESWWQYGLDTEARIPPELRQDYQHFMAHFRKWKERNIDGLNEPKTKGDDLHEPVVAQLEMIREAGLVEVDVYFSYRLWHAIAGRKAA